MNARTIRRSSAWIVFVMLWTALVGAGCGGADGGTDQPPAGGEATAEVGSALAGDPCTTAAQCNDGNPCTVDKCVQKACAYTNKSDGTACSDGNACTKSDTCLAGACAGGPAVVCAPPNQCQTASGCNPSTGRCVYVAKAGSACDDGNTCTQNDKCTASAAGVCKGTVRPRGSPCDDGNTCTVNDQCTGSAASVCKGTVQPNGSVCDDGNPNTAGDVCTAAVCAGVDHCVGVACAAIDQCHLAGMCIDHATGACSTPAKPDATACDDGNPNTFGDVCTGGVCAGTTNPCLTNNGGCSPNAACTFTSGSRTCACNTGFTGDGVTCTPARSGVDTTPPTLTAFSLSPTSIDTTGAPASVQASFTVADDLSGVSLVEVVLQSPSGKQQRNCNWSPPFPSAPLVATAACSVPFAQFGEGGTWVVSSVGLEDAVGNLRYLYPADLQAAAFPTTLTVNGGP